MASSWFYTHDGVKHGPFSSTELKGLAAAGNVSPIDTVWLEGNENGVPARRVKHLFAPAAPPREPIADVPATSTKTAPAHSEPPETKAPLKEKQRRGRATAIAGADITNQDGTNARFRKKCAKCGQKDSACHTIAITNRTYKTSFFCPKCRKQCEVVIRCTL